ncbi:uncharacterized protein [Porites lutea]|uniref:uncharacterized protein n=1 Tax=Porites lutea TaxID=51062 RepID=UPI003CC5BEE3
MLAVKEERTVIGGVELARKTVLAADDQGNVITEVTETRRDINLPGSVPVTAQPSAPPALPSPPAVVSRDPPSPPKEFSWVECCFKCESGYEWYELGGKGFCIVLLLLLTYLIVGTLILAYFLLLFALACFNCDSDD